MTQRTSSCLHMPLWSNSSVSKKECGKDFQVFDWELPKWARNIRRSRTEYHRTGTTTAMKDKEVLGNPKPWKLRQLLQNLRKPGDGGERKDREGIGSLWLVIPIAWRNTVQPECIQNKRGRGEKTLSLTVSLFWMRALNYLLWHVNEFLRCYFILCYCAVIQACI